jgi:hypothetical protein
LSSSPRKSARAVFRNPQFIVGGWPSSERGTTNARDRLVGWRRMRDFMPKALILFRKKHPILYVLFVEDDCRLLLGIRLRHIVAAARRARGRAAWLGYSLRKGVPFPLLHARVARAIPYHRGTSGSGRSPCF